MTVYFVDIGDIVDHHCLNFLFIIIIISIVNLIHFIFILFFKPEPFFLTFSLYDAKYGRKISEDFQIDPNESEILGMIPSDILHAADKLHSVEGKKTSPILNGLDENWLLSKKRQVCKTLRVKFIIGIIIQSLNYIIIIKTKVLLPQA